MSYKRLLMINADGKKKSFILDHNILNTTDQNLIDP